MNMFVKKITLSIVILLICCSLASAADNTEKEWLSGLLKWDAWNTPYSNTSKIAEMQELGKTSNDGLVCARKKESLKSVLKDVRIDKVYYI
jgi:hypothetical protein